MYTAILLAAGRSSRMGQPKGLLNWEGKPLILHQLEQLKSSAVHRIIIVLGHKPEVYEAYIKDDQSTILWNENWDQGKSSSILTGLTAVEDACEGVLFVNIDQPLSFRTVNQLIDSYERSEGRIHIPVFNGKKGHPVLFSTQLLPQLHAVTEETQGLKHVIRNFQDDIVLVNMEDSTILYNFNTPSDYKGERVE
jgi:molybdenum cofactor cytidylyltransferase